MIKGILTDMDGPGSPAAESRTIPRRNSNAARLRGRGSERRKA